MSDLTPNLATQEVVAVFDGFAGAERAEGAPGGAGVPPEEVSVVGRPWGTPRGPLPERGGSAVRVRHRCRKATQPPKRFGSAEVEGTIADLRVVDRGGSERWLVTLDGRPEAVFVFEPAVLLRPHKKGQRVRIGYAADPAKSWRLRVDWIAAA